MTLENMIFEMVLKGKSYKEIASRFPTTSCRVMTVVWKQAKVLREYYREGKDPKTHRANTIPYCKDVYDLRKYKSYWRKAIYFMESGR